jgi:glycerophosphoryl diester phosphodiesterase
MHSDATETTGPRFMVQGHRGARGLKPENTLPSFEAAFDLGVASVETDVHLSRDGVPVLAHDPCVSERLFRLVPGSTSPPPAPRLLISSLTLAELRGYRADRNPYPSRFSTQDATVTPLARLFAEERGMDPYAPPSVTDLFAFAEAYAGSLGARAGKSAEQQANMQRMCFDLELKRVPFHPEAIGDVFDGEQPGLLEQHVVAAIRAAGVVERTRVRSFDHRSVRAIGRLEPALTLAILVAGTAPADPAQLVRSAGAHVYCPEFTFLDAGQVRMLRAANIRLLPWTVNTPKDWARLMDWGVDGVTTDYPDRLVGFLA